MVEAFVTLRKGTTIMIVARGWEELSEQLDKLDVKSVEARHIAASELRQGKYTNLER